MYPTVFLLTLLACETAPKATPNIVPPKSELEANVNKPVEVIEDVVTDIYWDPTVLNGPDFMTDTLRDALHKGDWNKGATSITSDTPQSKILSTWLAIQSDQTKLAIDNYDTIAKTTKSRHPIVHSCWVLFNLPKANTHSARRQFTLIPEESHLKIQSQWLEAKYLLSQSTASEEQVQTTIQSLKTLAALEHPFDHGDAVLSTLIERSKGCSNLQGFEDCIVV